MSATLPAVGFIAIARPTFDVPLAEEKMRLARENLEAAGFHLVGPASLVMSADDVNTALDDLRDLSLNVLVVFQASFADSTMALQIAQQTQAHLLLWAVPEERVGGRLRLNSFCGINLAGHGLTRAGIAYDYAYLEPNDRRVAEKLHMLKRVADIRDRLRHTRVGRVGENPAGFDTCLVDNAALKSQLGLDVVQFDLETVFEAARQADRAEVQQVGQVVRSQVAGVDVLDQTATEGTLSTYVALKDLASQHNIDGFAVRCWPEFFTDLGCSACGAMSMLSNARTPCSCEADVNGTITQLILQWMSGESAFGSDLVSFDVDEDIAILWHCGLAPLSMADPDVQPEATIHSNRKMPLLMQFPLKPGRVTLARLSEATGSFRLVIAGGEMLKAPAAFTGTTGTLRFDSGAQAVMDAIMNEGLEHHLSLTYGDHIEALLALAKMLKLPVLRL